MVAEIRNYTSPKMGKGDHVAVDTLTKICGALNYGIADLMELVPDEAQ